MNHEQQPRSAICCHAGTVVRDTIVCTYSAFHAATDEGVTSSTPNCPEGHHPAPCVVVVVEGEQLCQILLGIPYTQRVISAGGQHPL